MSEEQRRGRRAPRPRVWLCAAATLLVLAIVPTPAFAGPPDHSGEAPVDAAIYEYRAFLPTVWQSDSGDVCAPIPGESYGSLSVEGAPTDRPAELHADLNLALRGYFPTSAVRQLVDYDGNTDPNAPQLAGLFADRRAPTIAALYRVYDWNWGSNRRGPLISSPVVTLMDLSAAPGETVHVPASGYAIGSGYQALLLYAGSERVTLKYTRNDNVVWGYTIHIEGVCVEPALLALYEAMNAAGRAQLPALRAGQAIGRARGAAIGVAIRDNGSFMDPRSRKDWWQGY